MVEKDRGEKEQEREGQKGERRSGQSHKTSTYVYICIHLQKHVGGRGNLKENTICAGRTPACH